MQNDESDFVMIYSENADPLDIETVRQGIIADAVKANMGRMTLFSFLMKDKKEKVVAGVVGYTMYGMLYTDMLWVDAKHRNKGWGKKLLNEAEKLGKKRGCRFSCLITMSWQALPLYQKLGYEIEYTTEGFENEAVMYHLKKLF